MSNWAKGLLAVGTGLAMAIAVLLPLPALVAFLCGTLAALLVLAGREEAPRPPEPAPAPPAVPDFGRALIEKLPTPLLILGRSGRVEHANRAARAALPSLGKATHFASVLRAPAFVEAVTATLADGEERHVAFSANPSRERFLEARLSMLPPGGPFGPDDLVIVQVADLTDAQRAETWRSDFIANASHELRTPLAAIVGYIETLQNHARDDAEARERFLAIMSREAGRMQRLVDDLMSLSRIEMNEHQRPEQRWPLAEIAAESAAALDPVAVRLGVTIESDLAGAAGEVQGDRDQLAQVFANLIDNAMRYGGAGCTVRVRPADDPLAGRAAPSGAPAPGPGRVGISVEDDGPGIERQHLHRLTERFYRVSTASSRNRGGTGLGLAIVKHILNRHQGRLEITSVPGQGSVFTVWLPLAAPEAAAGVAAGAVDRQRMTGA